MPKIAQSAFEATFRKSDVSRLGRERPSALPHHIGRGRKNILASLAAFLFTSRLPG
jgi:hypothetical protein